MGAAQTVLPFTDARFLVDNNLISSSLCTPGRQFAERARLLRFVIEPASPRSVYFFPMLLRSGSQVACCFFTKATTCAGVIGRV